MTVVATYDPVVHLEVKANNRAEVECGVRLLAGNSARDPYLFARLLASRRYRVCPDCEVQFAEFLEELREAGEAKRADLLLMLTYEGATLDDEE